MLEIKNAIFYKPNNMSIQYFGSIHNEFGRTIVEINNAKNEIGSFFFSPNVVDILYAENTDNMERFSLLNLAWKGSSLGNNRYVANEVYFGNWIEDAFEKKYNQCVVQMNGLAIWMDERLSKFSYKADANCIEVEHERERIFTISNTLKVIFRKFCSIEYEQLSVKVREKASLVIETNHPESRLFYNKIIDSLRYMLSMAFYKEMLIWEIDYKVKDKAEQTIIYKGSEIGTNEFFDRLDCSFSFKNINENILRKWISNQDYLNEINKLLVGSLSGIVAENRFLYCVKALELIYKNLYSTTTISDIENLIQKMIQQGVWENNWNKRVDPIKKFNNERILLCYLWEQFNERFELIATDGKAYTFLKKIHISRNYYTHYTLEKDIFHAGELYAVSNVLRAFSYGLILQYIGVDSKTIKQFIHRNTGFLDTNKPDLNIYSINYQHK